MKYALLLLLLVLNLSSCQRKWRDNCDEKPVPLYSLEKIYGCIDTKYTMKTDLDKDFLLIRNQETFAKNVSGLCQPQIDFSKYDLIIGQYELKGWLDGIEYKGVLITQRACKVFTLQVKLTKSLVLIGAFSKFTYHALVPKLDTGVSINVVFEVK